FTIDLTRTISESAPWNTIKDTRLAAGKQMSWSWTAQAPVQAPSGTWLVRATLHRTIQGTAEEHPILQQEVPLRMQ
ncbi:MAG: hypothetical protein ACI9MC_004234, partial [Kiritimatiellia bacterium]